jgi:2-oxoglutarate ferredoxin oxidoreductase subunit beta
MGIGGNHFIHAARRNIDLTVIMLDNHIYGMTGGQVAPTTPMHALTQTSPHGNPEPPINACDVAISCGASLVARWTTAHPKQMRKAIKKAINHKGFSFLHILSQCPTQAGRYIYDTSKSEEMLQQLKKQSITMQKAAKLSEEELAGRTVVGLLYETTDHPELCESIYALMQQGKGFTH